MVQINYISLMMQSRVILALYIWDTEHLVRCHLYILQDLRGRKWTNLCQREKYNHQSI